MRLVSILALLVSLPALAFGPAHSPWGSPSTAELKRIKVLPVEGGFPEEAYWVQFKNKKTKTYFVTIQNRVKGTCDYAFLDGSLKVIARFPVRTGMGTDSCERPIYTAFEDLNGDGLEDILSITAWSGTGDAYPFARAILNTAKGFVTDAALDKKLSNIASREPEAAIALAKKHFKSKGK